MHCLLHFRSIIVFFCIFLSTWIITRDPSAQQSIFQPYSTVWQLHTRWCINAVLINIPKFMVHCISHSIITLVRGSVFREIAIVKNCSISPIRYHWMRPPKCNSSYAIIVVIRDCISHLYKYLITWNLVFSWTCSQLGPTIFFKFANIFHSQWILWDWWWDVDMLYYNHGFSLPTGEHNALSTWK